MASAVLVVAQIASTAVTARLLVPREFGLYATAQAGAGLVGYFTMAAVGQGLQRQRRLGGRTVGTAMTLSFSSSFAVALILWLGASPWARAWGVPDAAAAVRVIALALFLTSSATVPVALIRRRLQFGRAAIVETGSLVIGLAAGVALAVQLHSAVALALGQTVWGATLLLASSAIVRDELRFCYDRGAARELLAFASQVSALNFGSYVAITAPSWFAARQFGASALGLYSRAFLIVYLPVDYVSSSIYKVLYPIYGRVRHDAERIRVLLDEALTLTTGFAWPLFGLLAGASPVVVRVLLGARFEGSAPLVSLFALGACASIASGLLTNAAEAFGWMRTIALRQAAFFGGVLAAMLTVFLADLSLSWLLAGVAAAQWAAYLLTLQPFIARDFLEAAVVLRSQLAHAAAAALAFAATAACARLLDHAPVAVQAAGQASLGALAVGAMGIGRSRFPAARVLFRRLATDPPRPSAGSDSGTGL
ncbi:MAG: oligosaccharide flippase family protein [Solirubrobacterales bacterium]